MNMTAPTIIKLKQIYPGLKGNNRRIADQLLKSPELLAARKVSDIASVCDCDSAQVIRFCKLLGFKGFTDLKARIVQELIPLHTENHCEERNHGDVFERLRQDYCRNIGQAVNDTVMHLDKDLVLKAVKKIREAGRIAVCGVGASNLTAQDLYAKLARMGFHVFWSSDQEMQKINCALLGEADLLIVFSFSGNSEAVIECMKTVKANGGTTLLITNYRNSPAAGLADLMLHTAADEEKFRIGAMTSRLAQLAIVDLLVLLLTLNYPDEVNRNILKTYQVIHTK